MCGGTRRAASAPRASTARRRCEGRSGSSRTTARVPRSRSARGSVRFEDFVRHRTVVVSEGHSYTAGSGGSRQSTRSFTASVGRLLSGLAGGRKRLGAALGGAMTCKVPLATARDRIGGVIANRTSIRDQLDSLGPTDEAGQVRGRAPARRPDPLAGGRPPLPRLAGRARQRARQAARCRAGRPSRRRRERTGWRRRPSGGCCRRSTRWRGARTCGPGGRTRSEMRGRRVLLLLAVAALAGAAAVVVHQRHSLRRAEQLALDARYAIRGTDRQKVAGIVLVNVDDRTFSEFRDEGLQAQWPFPRRYHARVIDRLRRAGREGDRVRRPVHRTHEGGRRQRADRRGRPRRQRGPEHDDRRAARQHERARRRRRAARARRASRRHERDPGQRRRDPLHAVRDPGPGDVRRRGGEGHRAPGVGRELRRTAPPGADRLRRAAGHRPRALLLARVSTAASRATRSRARS